jgi:lysophospholipase L1-like esterase
MSDFFLRFDLPKTEYSINHSHKLTFLGSCFSDEMSKYAKGSGFDVVSNPYGTIYHPISIANNLSDALHEVTQFADFERDGFYYSWNCSTKINASSREELNHLLSEKNRKLLEHLSQPGFLFVTFGTAFIYRLKNENKYVANCHKQPGQFFLKELSNAAAIVETWKELLQKMQVKFPQLKVVFTVSPVRHIRDGIIENNRSKARLIQVVEELSSGENVAYFPSYEIVMDELRDYRFFQEDRIHPTLEATKYIWNRFSDMYFNEQTKKVVEDCLKVKKRLAHRSALNHNLDLNTLKSMQYLESHFPWISWNAEK